MPCPGDPQPQTHPRHLATEARLFGLRPAAVETARVLEIGCGDGGNLLPMAEGLRDATFVGLDLSPQQIASARETADAAEIDNVRLEVGNLADWTGGGLGEFDYVIAHDLYSGIPPRLRDALLETIRASLAPDGVAFVSFDVLPGSRLRALIRDALRAEVREISGPEDQIETARSVLDRLAAAPAWGDGRLGQEVRAVARLSDALLFHDVLGPVRDGVSLMDFVAHANRHRLEWVTEARLSATVFGTHEPEVAAALTAVRGDRVEWEERLDALTLRPAREALLCRDDRTVTDTPDPAAVRDLLIASRLEFGSFRTPKEAGLTEAFRSPGGTISTDHPLLKAALVELGICWPEALPYGRLIEDARARAGDKNGMHDEAPVAPALAGAYAGGLIELHAQAPTPVDKPGRRPSISPLARLQAARGTRLTNRWHEPVDLDGGLARRLAATLDGTYTHDQLLGALGAKEEALDEALRQLGALRLLTA
jgi:SAM-dependent methyltransferase